MDRTEILRIELKSLLDRDHRFTAQEAIDVVRRQLKLIAHEISVSKGLVYRYLDSDDIQSEDLAIWVDRISTSKEDPSIAIKEFLLCANWESINHYFEKSAEDASLKESDMAYWAISQRLGLYGGSPHQPRKIGQLTEYKLILEHKSKRINDHSLALKQIALGLLAIERGEKSDFSAACEEAAAKLRNFDSMSSISVGTILYKDQPVEISVINCQVRIKVSERVRKTIDAFSIKNNLKSA